VITTKTIYVFSGLGADERVFYKINFGNHNTVFIKWVLPHKDETIENYAFRLTTQIHTFRPILVGLSFGGMMAVEVAKHIETEKIILISSAKSKNEIPFYFRFAGWLGIHKIIPSAMLVNVNIFTNWFFSNRSLEDKKMLSAILHDTNPLFLKWAIAKIVTWKNETVPLNLQHIHGTADRILPLKNINAQKKIIGGSHLMIVNCSDEVSKLLNIYLNK
jgi:pimeloyl-ACP methyl ester carboxylesterase